MSQNCRFNRSYVRATKTYTLSFKGLSKRQADIISHIFCSLESCGIVYTYHGGLTLPELDLRCSIPLERGSCSTLVVPNASLSALALLFNNRNFPTRDVITSSTFPSLYKLNTY